MADFSQQLLQTIVALARELPPSVLSALALHLASIETGLGCGDLSRFAATSVMRERIRTLQESFAQAPGVDGRSVSLALEVAALAAEASRAEQRVGLAWTGPATESIPVRRVDQVLYELVESATSELLLATYAAYRATRLWEALRRAADRRVRIVLVMELAEESGGKLSFDELDSIRATLPEAEIHYWPLERRPRAATGRHGSMHVKCIVADGSVALVSSANLTDYALELNMELGVVVEGDIASQLARHFAQLILRGELKGV